MYKNFTKTDFLGKEVLFLPQCHSTNEIASSEDAVIDGKTIITQWQTSGKGQRGNTWEAERGKNITSSIVHVPTYLQPSQQFYLNMAVALSIRNVVNYYVSGDVKVKWPNDIMVGNKKICGILIENQFIGKTIEKSVIGIGLNVNQSYFRLERAISLKQISGFEYDLYDVLEEIMLELEGYIMALKAGRFDEIRQAFINQLFGLNAEMTFTKNSEYFSGTIIGVSEQGKLAIKVKEEINFFETKQVSYVF